MPACNFEGWVAATEDEIRFNAALGNARMQYRPREAAWDGGRMSGFWKPQLFSRKNAEIGKRHVLKNSRKNARKPCGARARGVHGKMWKPPPVSELRRFLGLNRIIRFLPCQRLFSF